jgi:hypothetical protein
LTAAPVDVQTGSSQLTGLSQYIETGVAVRTAPDEPTPQELDLIEREWPLIEAEMALVAAEIRVLTAAGGPTALDWRRLRRAEHRVLRKAVRMVAEVTVSADNREVA